jgi:hypothetical protein
MAHALNFTVPIKQDPASLAILASVKAKFAKEIQPKIEDAARRSKIVHFARIVVIHDKYIQVLTEYDGSHEEYAEWFRKNLNDLFKEVFSFADVSVDWASVNNQAAFYEVSKTLQIRSLGDSVYGEKDFDGNLEGYLFSAYKDREVKDILPKLEEERRPLARAR